MPKTCNLEQLWCKIARIGECSALFWSFNFFSKLLPAANRKKNCQIPFCPEVHVHEVYLAQDNNDSDKAIHNLQLTSS